MKAEGIPTYYAEDEGDPIGVVDVEGHNVVLYARKLIEPDAKTRTLKPTLAVRATVPSVTKEGYSDLRYDLISKVEAFLAKRLGAAYIVTRSTDGLEFMPKTVEHIEREERHVDMAGVHPALFEQSRASRQDMLDCLDPMVSDVQAVLAETRSDLELLASEPPPPETALRAARDVLQSSKGAWVLEEAAEKTADDGHVMYVPAHCTGMCAAYQSSLPDDLHWDALEHGMRAFFAQENLDMDIVGRRVFGKGAQGSCMFFIRSTPESYARLREHLWGETPEAV